MESERIRIDDVALRREMIWGLPSIAKFLNLGIDTVRDLAKDPDVPIYKPAGRYVAVRSELWRWLRTKPIND